VTWENPGLIDHTVTRYAEEVPDSTVYFASGGFDSEQTARQNEEDGLIANGQTFEHTFDRPGRYEYFCIPHESAGMTGTIRVE
jgi:plastocyanin